MDHFVMKAVLSDAQDGGRAQMAAVNKYQPIVVLL